MGRHSEIWMKEFKPYMGYESQWFGPNTYSCCGEDLVVTQLFWKMGIQKPTYLDIGAHHPFNLSNTALLYSRGCSGVNVEANPKLIPEFTSQRPRDVNVNVGVAPQAGKLTFYMWDDRSGRNTCSEEWAKKMDQMTETMEVSCITLDHVVAQYCGGTYPDFLSIDIEGLDYDVLAGADFSQSSPKVVCVETLPEERDKFVLMMAEKGYSLVVHLAVDLIFIRMDLKMVHNL